MIRWLAGVAGVVVAGLGLNMAASELFGYGTTLGLWFVRQWVRLLPPDQRDRYREEWQADVIHRAKGPDPGNTGGNHQLTAMAWGFWTLRAAMNQTRLLHRCVQSEWSERLAVGLIFGEIIGLLVGSIGGLTVASYAGVGLSEGLAVGLGLGLLVGLAFGLAYAFVYRRAGWLFYGLGSVYALAGGVTVGRTVGPVAGLVVVLVVGLAYWLGPAFAQRTGSAVVGWLRVRL